jgi:hypothetical protein
MASFIISDTEDGENDYVAQSETDNAVASSPAQQRHQAQATRDTYSIPSDSARASPSASDWTPQPARPRPSSSRSGTGGNTQHGSPTRPAGRLNRVNAARIAKNARRKQQHNTGKQASSPVSQTDSDKTGTDLDTEAETSHVDAEDDALSENSVQDEELQDEPARRAAAIKGRSKMWHAMRILEGEISDLADSSEDDLEFDDDDELAPLETQVMQDFENRFTQEELEVPDCQPIGELPHESENIRERHHFTKLVAEIDEKGLNPVILKARRAEGKADSSHGQYYGKDKEGRNIWVELSLLTLCTMHPRVIQELVHGNLVVAASSDPDLMANLSRYQEFGKRNPIIYARIMADKDGNPLSVKDARRLIKWLLRYIAEDPALAEEEFYQKALFRVDRQYYRYWKQTRTQQGRRFYLESREGHRSGSRVQVIEDFCLALQARCDQHKDENERLSPPLLYIGYAGKADVRQRQHEACGKSSNFLASLVQAICNVLWGRGAYSMHFFVICVICEEAQGTVAEMLLSRIPGAYYHTGGGFCVDIAGKSMESIHFRKLTREQVVDRWAEISDWVEENTPLAESSAIEREHHAAMKEQLAEAEAPYTAEELVGMTDTIKRIRRTYELCQRMKNHSSWQDEPMKARVALTELQWKTLRAMLYGEGAEELDVEVRAMLDGEDGVGDSAGSAS